MKLRLTTRVAGAGAAAALAVAGLVGIGSTTADAADVAPSPYLCSVVGRSMPVLVAPLASVEVPPLASGFEIPADAQAIGVNFTISEEVLAGFKEQAGATMFGLSADDFAFPVGSATAVPVTGLAVANTAIPATGDLTLAGSGMNGSFVLPNPGTYGITMPTTFSAVISTDATGPLPEATCTLQGDSPVLGSMTVVKQDSFATATGPAKPIKKGKPAKVVAAFNGAFKTATGKATAKEGSKTLGTETLKKGKATFIIKNLKPGTHTITLSYPGDKSTNGSSTSVSVVVVK